MTRTHLSDSVLRCVSIAAVVILCAAARQLSAGTLQDLIDAAKPGQTVNLPSGTFDENLTVAKRLTLSGAGIDVTTIAVTAGNCITVSARVTIENMTLNGGNSADAGVHGASGARMTVRNCKIMDCSDGLGFDSDFNVTAVVYGCTFEHCGDAIDLESTQAIIFNNQFINSTDDALDLDGNAGAIFYKNTVTNCGDDGVEIRLSVRAHAVIVENVFDTCGEDGVELIESTAADPKNNAFNQVIIARNQFLNCTRHGVGGVDNVGGSEVPTAEMVGAGLYGEANTFTNCGLDVTPNLWPVDLTKDWSAESVTVSGTYSGTFPMHSLVPLAIYDLNPDPAGNNVSDCEGVTLDDNHIMYLADDNSSAVWVFDPLSGCRFHMIDGNPLPGGTVLTGLEGVSFAPHGTDRCLWMSDDDDCEVAAGALTAAGDVSSVYEVVDASTIHPSAEGIEVVGDILYVTGSNSLTAMYLSTKELLSGFPCSYNFGVYGNSVYGVGWDGSRLLCAHSHYSAADPITYEGLAFAADPATGEVQKMWTLGNYSTDPRGIAEHHGLIYVADGYGQTYYPAPYDDTRNRIGLKVFVFTEEPLTTLEPLLDYLPLRSQQVPPRSDAGSDQEVTDQDGDGAETVTLDGSASIDLDGTIQSWTWFENGDQIATGETPDVSFSVGTHVVELVVSDVTGATSVDVVEIVIRSKQQEKDDDKDGCGCQAGSGGASATAAFLVAAFGLVFALRRNRRRIRAR